MPDEEVLEEGVLNPVKPEIQDPLLRALLADEPAAAPVAADTPQEKPQAVEPEADEVDCVVIGLGAGGAPLLARLAQKARIPVRIGTRNRWRHWLSCNRLVALSRRHSPLHEAQLNLQLLRPLGGAAETPLPAVAPLVRLEAAEPLAEPWQRLLHQRQPGQLNVILHPRSRGSAREWGLVNFGRLAQLLHAAGHRVFITGTAAEGEELADWLRENAAFLAANLTGQLSLPQFIAFIAAADGLVAGSTGPLHLAAALGRHALGLYPPIRPMDPGRWAPLGAHASYLVFDKPACQDCRGQPATCACIRAIGPLEVAAHVLAWLPPAAG